jgi:hypothetical protein
MKNGELGLRVGELYIIKTIAYWYSDISRYRYMRKMRILVLKIRLKRGCLIKNEKKRSNYHL